MSHTSLSRVFALARPLFAAVLVLSLLTVLVPPTATPSFAGVTDSATLTIVSSSVEVRVGSSGVFGAALDGQAVSAGTSIRTGTSGLALVTFFDGSEITVSQNTEITLVDANQNPGAPGLVRVFQGVGTTVHRVVSVNDPGSVYEVDTPQSTALVRGTKPLVTVDPSGFTRITNLPEGRGGGLVLVRGKDANGTLVNLEPNFETLINTGGAPSAPQFLPNLNTPTPIAATATAVPTKNALAAGAVGAGGAGEPTRTPTITPTPIFSPTPIPTNTPVAAATPALSYSPRAPGQFIYGALSAYPGRPALAKAAGFNHIWYYVAWKNIEPTRGNYIWKTLDQWGNTTPNDLTNVLTAAKENNLKLVLRLSDVPDWAGGSVKNVDTTALENYVFEAVSYGKGTIEIVEVFNELNLPFEWGGSPDPGAYVRILAAANRGAKRADPNVKVVAAAVSPRTGGLGGTMEDVDWLDAFYKAGGKDHFDWLGMHPYVGSFDPAADSSCSPMCFRTIELWRDVMLRNGDTRSAFITEVGTLEAGSNDLGQYQWMRLPAAQRAEYLVKALQLANGNYPWIAGAMVFNLDYAVDTHVNPPGSERHWFSLLNSDGSPRQAFTAFQAARRDGRLP